MILEGDYNNYIESTNLLLFPTSKLRKSPTETLTAYPDGRRFSEFNIIQLLNSIIDYQEIEEPGFVCDYVLTSNDKAIQECTLLIHGYIFKLVNQQISLDEDWYASIIVQHMGSGSLSKTTEDMIYLTDRQNSFFEPFCDGLILTHNRPQVDLDGKQLFEISDPTGMNELISGTSRLYTIPLVVNKKIITHKFTSKSIKNIDGGTC